MRRRLTLTLFALVWLMAGSPAADAACAQPRLGRALPDLGSECRTLRHGGVERSYRLVVPPGRSNEPRSLVIILHGGGGAGISMVATTIRQLLPLAQRQPAVFVYPDALHGNWNDGRDDFDSAAHRDNVDDAGFILALIDHLASEQGIDQHRVFALGVSNGAMMVNRLLCESADRFAAAATLIGSMPAAVAAGCRPPRPTPTLMINGTEDRLVPYGGGAVARTRGTVIGVEATAALLAKANGCDGRRDEMLPDRDPTDGTTVARIDWSGCERAPVVLYRIDGGGHTWPGGPQYAAPQLTGRISRELDAIAEVWRFWFER
jgi:polyhydroxybutyrate depolymerase